MNFAWAESRTVIFDSAILDFASRRNFRGIQNVEVSQRKLNCALFVKNSLIKNFAGPSGSVILIYKIGRT
ncbi:MAG: hypothetical protein DME97_07465 [Verrucomicrobia bacterium]|nr:MAG: hypothetical protein DME97_07465 [Verrucomicrobiota bacterium]